MGNYIVPAGKRLVVEHVTAFAQVPAGQTVSVNRLQGSATDLSGQVQFEVATSGYLIDTP